MPTLCLFLLPPSPAHPEALYLANSRTGRASVHRSRAGQDPQAQCRFLVPSSSLATNPCPYCFLLSVKPLQWTLPPSERCCVSQRARQTQRLKKKAFHIRIEKYQAVIKHWTDSAKPNADNHCPAQPQARRRSKKTPGTSASHAYMRLALMIAHSSVKCKAAHCTALRRHTDSDSITEASSHQPGNSKVVN